MNKPTKTHYQQLGMISIPCSHENADAKVTATLKAFEIDPSEIKENGRQVSVKNGSITVDIDVRNFTHLQV